jgi:predicted secreted protein
MKKRVLLPLILSTSLFGVDIDFSKSFSKEITQDEAYSYISIFSKKDTQKKSINSLNKIMDFIKKDKTVKINGLNQNTYPEYEYSKFSSKRFISGYKSTINFTLSSTNGSIASSYINNLMKFNKDDININYSNLGWRISKELKEKTKDLLRLNILNWSSDYSKVLEKTLVKKCELLNINIGSNGTFRPVYTPESYSSNRMAKSIASDSVSVSMPNSGIEDFTLNSSFRYRCK